MEPDVHADIVGHLTTLAPSWLRALRAANKAPKTIRTYKESADQFVAFLDETGMPPAAAKITREHVEMFIERLAEAGRAPATVATRYRGLQSLFKWLEAEGEITSSPMARMSPPHVPERPVPVLPNEDVHKLLKTCSGKAFEDRRDEAILRVFIDAGLRLSEVANLRYDPADEAKNDVDLDRSMLRVVRKGRREGVAFIGKKTTVALDRYIRRDRAGHRHAGEPYLFLSRVGRMTASGIWQMVVTRAERAGIGHVHPHALRHLSVHHMKSSGMPDELIMVQAGWRSPAMLSRYAASTRTQRLADAWKNFSPGDQF